MDNISAVTALCTAICSSFYPDSSAVEIALFNSEVSPTDSATPKDSRLLRVAVSLVKGYVESSRSEGGSSVSTDVGKIDDSIRYWCKVYDVDEADILVVNPPSTIEDGSNLW